MSGRVLTASAINAHNTFEAPENVEPRELTGIKTEDSKLMVTLPAKSVVVIAVE